MSEDQAWVGLDAAVAKLAGFRKIKRRGHRLLLERQ